MYFIFSKVLQEVVCNDVPEALHSLETEMNLVRTFVELEKMRFGNRVEFLEDISERECLVPIGLVYEIVHNAIEYRLSKNSGGGTICVKCTNYNNGFLIEVSDKGKTAYKEELLSDSEEWINDIRYEVETLCAGSVREKRNSDEVKVDIFLPDL